MDKWIRGAGLTAALVAVAAMPAQAQTGWGSFGLHGGYQLGGKLAEAENEIAGAGDLNYDDEFSGGLSLEFWMGEARRLGLRFDGSYTEGGFRENAFILDDNDVNLWMYDANLMYRFSEPTPDSKFIPFLSAGVGGMIWNRADNFSTGYPPADAYVTDKESELALTFSLGGDWFVSDNVSLRLEAKDYYNLESPYTPVGTSNEAFDGGHNIQLRAGLNFFWGGRARVVEPGFIQEEVEPEPRREPVPEPAPVTRMESICVVQPDGDIEMVSATRYVDTNRLVVNQNGREVAFATAYPARTPVYVQGATWYTTNRSLNVDLEGNRNIRSLEFVTFGSPSTMSASSLEYVGSINGTPVYANRNDVSAIMPRLRTALQSGNDLQVILRNDAQLAGDFAKLETFYVAVEPGCVFRPISLTTNVRATRG